MNEHLLLRFTVSLLVLACGCQAPERRPATPKAIVQSKTAGESQVAPDVMGSLNQQFLDGYKERQAQIKSNTSPLIVGNFNTLTL